MPPRGSHRGFQAAVCSSKLSLLKKAEAVIAHSGSLVHPPYPSAARWNEQGGARRDLRRHQVLHSDRLDHGIAHWIGRRFVHDDFVVLRIVTPEGFDESV